MNTRMVTPASCLARSLAVADDRRRHGTLLVRMLLIALLICVQGLAPFVHAHAGSASTRGWHLHTDADRTPQFHQPALGLVPIETAIQPVPAGSEARAVGVAAGLPQGRDAASESPRPPLPDSGPPSARPGMPIRGDGAGCDRDLRIRATVPAPSASRADRLPPNRAPPLSA